MFPSLPFLHVPKCYTFCALCLHQTNEWKCEALVPVDLFPDKTVILFSQIVALGAIWLELFQCPPPSQNV